MIQPSEVEIFLSDVKAIKPASSNPVNQTINFNKNKNDPLILDQVY